MDLLKLISFLTFLGFNIRGAPIEQTLKSTSFDMTMPMLQMASERTKIPYDTLAVEFARYDTSMEKLSLLKR